MVYLMVSSPVQGGRLLKVPFPDATTPCQANCSMSIARLSYLSQV